MFDIELTLESLDSSQVNTLIWAFVNEFFDSLDALSFRIYDIIVGEVQEPVKSVLAGNEIILKSIGATETIRILDVLVKIPKEKLRAIEYDWKKGQPPEGTFKYGNTPYQRHQIPPIYFMKGEHTQDLTKRFIGKKKIRNPDGSVQYKKVRKEKILSGTKSSASLTIGLIRNAFNLSAVNKIRNDYKTTIKLKMRRVANQVKVMPKRLKITKHIKI